MGTTNIELIELAKCLSIPNFNCICIDEQYARIINPINGGLLQNALNQHIIYPIRVLLKQGLGHQGLGHTSPTSPYSFTIIIVNLNDSEKM